jgi:hypothetical protein
VLGCRARENNNNNNNNRIRRTYLILLMVKWISQKSDGSFCRQQKALAVLCEVVSSVATVRLTW